MHDIENLTEDFYKNPTKRDGYDKCFFLGPIGIRWLVAILLMPIVPFYGQGMKAVLKILALNTIIKKTMEMNPLGSHFQEIEKEAQRKC